MRGTLGFLLLAAGVWLLYLVVTGRWTSLSATPTSAPPAGVTQVGTPSGGGLIDNGSGQYLPGGTIGPGQKGSGPDVSASPGGMHPLPGGISTHTPGGLPTMQEFYGTTQGRLV